jgi:hypothetical protein
MGKMLNSYKNLFILGFLQTGLGVPVGSTGRLSMPRLLKGIFYVIKPWVAAPCLLNHCFQVQPGFENTVDGHGAENDFDPRMIVGKVVLRFVIGL